MKIEVEVQKETEVPKPHGQEEHLDEEEVHSSENCSSTLIYSETLEYETVFSSWDSCASSCFWIWTF